MHASIWSNTRIFIRFWRNLGKSSGFIDYIDLIIAPRTVQWIDLLITLLTHAKRTWSVHDTTHVTSLIGQVVYFAPGARRASDLIIPTVTLNQPSPAPPPIPAQPACPRSSRCLAHLISVDLHHQYAPIFIFRSMWQKLNDLERN